MRLARLTAFGLLALAAALCSAPEARAQWVTNGNHITNSNPGNVGVGTMNPAQIFHVHSPGTWAGTRVTTGATGATVNDGVNFGYDDQYGAYIWNREATSVVLSTSNTERMRVDAAGNVGVGTPAPAVKLAVNGAGANIYNTDAWIENNMHIQGNETMSQGGGRGRMRLGSAWGYVGLYAETSSAGAANDLVLGAGSGNVRVGPGGNITQNFIVPVGNVGIGTATPTASRLHIYSPGNTYFRIGAPLANQSSIAFNDDANGQDIVLYRPENTRDFSIWTATASNVVRVTQAGKVGIGTTTPTTALHVVGDVTVTGNLSAKYQDVAEWVPSTQALAAGTVVALDTERANHVVASASAYDTRVAGVVSAQPGLSLGERGEGKVLVATTGRVKIKVNAANAPIRIGDLLVTSDVPGVAMKSEPIAVGGRQIHAPGTIIGKALESLDKGTGEILVLLSLQ